MPTTCRTDQRVAKKEDCLRPPPLSGGARMQGPGSEQSSAATSLATQASRGQNCSVAHSSVRRSPQRRPEMQGFPTRHAMGFRSRTTGRASSPADWSRSSGPTRPRWAGPVEHPTPRSGRPPGRGAGSAAMPIPQRRCRSHRRLFGAGACSGWRVGREAAADMRGSIGRAPRIQIRRGTRRPQIEGPGLSRCETGGSDSLDAGSPLGPGSLNAMRPRWCRARVFRRLEIVAR